MRWSVTTVVVSPMHPPHALASRGAAYVEAITAGSTTHQEEKRILVV
jgi:hypothetical protein